MVELNTLANKVFSLLKGNGLKIKIFDVDGNEVTDPSMGRRFFVTNPNIMVTISEDDNTVELSKGTGINKETIDDVENGIKRLSNEFQMDYTLKVFGKSIQPRDYAYQAKMQKDTAMMENSSVQPYNHQLLGKVLHRVKFFGSAGAHTLADDLGLHLSDVQPILNRLAKAGKIVGTPNPHGDVEYSASVEEAVMETSDEKLEKHRKALYKASGDADKKGDTATANKRFKQGIAADIRQIDRAAAKRKAPATESISESFSKMFGSAFTSHQTLENVRILVKHKAPVNEEVRGARSRHIAAIFLECNGERFRFQHNYLAGARAMANHLAHGGAMGDKVGAYISESVGQLLKLQSFNRYVTSNNLINEDSSGIVETVKENINTIRSELKKLTGVKTYETVKARLETFEREQLDENDTTQLKELFTIRRFDEKFEEVLPIVKQLVQEKDTYHKRIEEAAGAVITLRREAISTVPMMEFASENARLGFKLNELALRIVENDELAGFINKIGTKMCKEGTMNDFEKAVLTQVFENAKVEEKKVEEMKDIKESYDLETFFDKFDYTFL